MPETKKIAITGGGLVGSLLALYLTRRGYEITVYERRPDQRKTHADRGRSINLALSARGLLALDELGLSDIVRSIAIPMHGRMIHDPEGNLSFQPYGKEGQFINSVSRGDLNVMLMNAAEAAGAKFLFEHRCVNVNLEKTEVTWSGNSAIANASNAILQDPAALFTQQFDLIIGADGAFSAVRTALQFTDRFDYSQDFLDHGYKELHIPAGKDGQFLLEKNALHIWLSTSLRFVPTRWVQ